MATTTPQTSDAAGERRRARDQRGIRSSAAMKAQERLPSPPRQRRPALAALAVLLIVGGAAVAALLAMRVDSRVPVLQANQTIAAGQQLTPDMFTTTQVAAEGTHLVPESQAEKVYGTYAATTIQAEQVLDAKMLSRTGFLGDGKAEVGAALEAGRFPSGGLQAGDLVDLVRITESGSETIVEDAAVSSAGGAAGGGDVGTSITEFSFTVDRADAAAVAAAGANNALSVVLVERGGGVGDSPADSGDGSGDASGDGGAGSGESADAGGEDSGEG